MDPKPPTLDYETSGPAVGAGPFGKRPAPNPPAAIAMMLGWFNVIWTFIGATVACGGSDAAAAMLLPGVIVSSSIALWTASRARRDGVRVAAVAINVVCLMIALIAGLVVIAAWLL